MCETQPIIDRKEGEDVVKTNRKDFTLKYENNVQNLVLLYSYNVVCGYFMTLFTAF